MHTNPITLQAPDGLQSCTQARTVHQQVSLSHHVAASNPLYCKDANMLLLMSDGFWGAAEAGGADPKLRSTNQEVAQLLEQVAALGEDVGEADLTPPSNHASQRFAAAVKAAVAADVRTKATDTK